MVRESGRTLGLVITGGSDTPVRKVLIRQVDRNSPASACSVPLKAGDEILEVNGKHTAGLQEDIHSLFRKCFGYLLFYLFRIKCYLKK